MRYDNKDYHSIHLPSSLTAEVCSMELKENHDVHYDNLHLRIKCLLVRNNYMFPEVVEPGNVPESTLLPKDVIQWKRKTKTPDREVKSIQNKPLSECRQKKRPASL